MTEQPATRFPADIILPSPPLAEAWLEIRWTLEPMGPPNMQRDRGYQIALGRFTEILNDDFPFVEDLDASQLPTDMVPHTVRHRFRAEDGTWPLIQLGPGVATVNFTDPYSWEQFREMAGHLQSTLIRAYRASDLETAATILRYRNATPFDHSEEDFLSFLNDRLNVQLGLPAHLPGNFVTSADPRSVKLDISFALENPAGVGSLQVGTGIRTQENEEIAVWELSVSSTGDLAPSLNDEGELAEWLDDAHIVLHEWFFALIEGPLMEQFSQEEA